MQANKTSQISEANAPILAPSILAANHANLAEGLQTVSAAGCTWVHLDIMDGNFVPNLSFGPQTVACLRAANPAPTEGEAPTPAALFFDVHLMLARPDKYIDAFAGAGADLISIHIEPEIENPENPDSPDNLKDVYNVAATLAAIKARGLQCGVVLNPGTPAEVLFPYLESIDLLLVMTVQPGFGGQSFQATCLEKIATFAAMRKEKGLHFRIEVDGGVDARTAPQCLAAGADTLVAGTAFFKAEDRTAFRKSIEE